MRRVVRKSCGRRIMDARLSSLCTTKRSIVEEAIVHVFRTWFYYIILEFVIEFYHSDEEKLFPSSFTRSISFFTRPITYAPCLTINTSKFYKTTNNIDFFISE